MPPYTINFIIWEFRRVLWRILYASLKGVSHLTILGHLTYVPLVPQTLFWYQKKRNEISLTYLEDFTPIGTFSLKFSQSQKSVVVDHLKCVDH